MRRLCATLAALAASAGLEAVEPIERPTVTVGGFAIEPMSDLSWADHRLELHPKALAGVGWNSNVFATADDAVSDGFWRVVAGLETRWHAAPNQLAVLDAEIESQQYLSEEEGDLVGGRGGLEYVREGPLLAAGGRIGFERTDRPQEQTGEQIEFDEWTGDVELDWRGNSARAVAGLEASRTDYREDAIFFGPDERDAWRTAARLRLGRTYARDSQRYVRARVARTTYENEGRFNDSFGGELALGVEHLLGTRTVGFVDLGVDARSYDDDFRGDPSFDDATVIYPIGSLGVRWSPEPLSGAQARLVADVFDSVTSNAAWSYGLVLDGRMRLRHNLSTFADGSVRHLVDSGADGGEDPEERTTLQLGAGLAYQLIDGAAARLRASWTDSSAVRGLDYDRIVVAFETGFVF